MNRRWWFVAVLVLGCVGGGVSARVWGKSMFSRTQQKTIHWQTNLNAAHKIAVAQDKPMLLVFGAPWCTYCRKLEQQVMCQPKVADMINQQFVPVHLDFQKDRWIVDVLEVSSLPTTCVLSSRADVLGTIVGYVEKDKFQQSLQATLDLDKQLKLERDDATR